MTHAHTLFLDERHANLLTSIVLLWFVWAIAAAYAHHRWGRGYFVVIAACIGDGVMALNGLGVYALQWVIFAVAGVMWERGRR